MPDIAMCTNKLCPNSKKCYRFLAEPSHYRQSYGLFEYSLDKDGNVVCDYYWPVSTKKEVNKLNKEHED